MAWLLGWVWECIAGALTTALLVWAWRNRPVLREPPLRYAAYSEDEFLGHVYAFTDAEANWWARQLYGDRVVSVGRVIKPTDPEWE